MDASGSFRHSHREYKKSFLTLETIHKDPLLQFSIWFEDAEEAGFPDPNAMSLSTVAKNGRPSSRVVLLKDFSQKGFVFFTNYESRKGKEMEENSYVSVLFFWDVLERQVRIEGKVEKLSPTESDEYYQTRPYSSRIGAWASRQSSTLRSRFTLMRQVAQMILKYPISVPLPPFWGGYRLIPDSYEFWQGRASRLHDRFKYSISNDNWNIERLYP